MSENHCAGNCFLTEAMLVPMQKFLLKSLCSSELALPCFCAAEMFMAHSN